MFELIKYQFNGTRLNKKIDRLKRLIVSGDGEEEELQNVSRKIITYGERSLRLSEILRKRYAGVKNGLIEFLRSAEEITHTAMTHATTVLIYPQDFIKNP